MHLEIFHFQAHPDPVPDRAIETETGNVRVVENDEVTVQVPTTNIDHQNVEDPERRLRQRRHLQENTKRNGTEKTCHQRFTSAINVYLKCAAKTKCHC